MTTDTAKMVLHTDRDGRQKFEELWKWAKPRLQAGQKLWISLKPAKRSLEQNALWWSCLTDLSRQLLWPVNGEMQHLSPEDWKDILSAGLRSHQRAAKGIEGGFVMLGARTSRMTVAEMADLITLTHAFGAQHGIKWSRTSLGREVPDEVCA